MTHGHRGCDLGSRGWPIIVAAVIASVACVAPRYEPELPDAAAAPDSGTASAITDALPSPEAANGSSSDGPASLPDRMLQPPDAPPADVSAQPSSPDAPTAPRICPTGTHLCPGSGGEECRSNSDPLSCGRSCDPCSAPDNGIATCNAAQTCDFVCGPSATFCSDSGGNKSSCGLTTWSFESGGVDDWLASGTDDGTLVGALTVAEGPARSGTRSLRGTVNVRPGKDQLLFGRPLCPGVTSMDRRARSLHLQMLIEGAPAGSTHRCAIAAYGRAGGEESVFIGPSGSGDGRSLIAQSGVWNRIEYRIVEPHADTTYYMYLTCILSLERGPWTGTVYIDDIGID